MAAHEEIGLGMSAPGPSGQIPVSTYRLQLHHGFGFAEACALVPYLAALGVTDCYMSPYLMASPGSTHGYDICDHNRFNPEVGSAEAYAAFAAALRSHGMGQIADIVPNHMGVDEAANPWWRDVLENGPCSPFAGFFDIDWEPVKDELHQKVLLPILGDQYGLVLEQGHLQLLFERGSFSLRYFDRNLPLNPRHSTRLLEYDLESLRRQLDEGDPDLLEFLSIITALRNLPLYTETDPVRVAERHREKEVTRERLERLAARAPHVAMHIEKAVRAFNGRAGRPDSFDRLHELLEVQPYRLAYWRTAAHEINYRRFFDINRLAGLRMHDLHVFDATHGLILRLIGERSITGLRIDHIDGLFDPQEYLVRLREAIRRQRANRPSAAPHTDPFYIVTEKILSVGESLPEHWPVAGTTGYDFLNDLNGVFVDRRNQRALQRVYQRFTKLRTTFAEHIYASKKLIMDGSMASELNVLARALNRLSERDRRNRDFTLNSLRDALQEVVACSPIYRTYASGSGRTNADRAAIDTAIRRARQRNPAMESSIFSFVRDVLLPDDYRVPRPDDDQQRLTFAMKFQQYTGPVQAKGVEDTAFYRHTTLLSLNEVGGCPERFGCTVGEFHAANRRRAERWPHTMLATATHDTKRGEDVRARLNVLSELPEEWGRCIALWARLNRRHRTLVDQHPAPDRNDEYRYYQTLLGAWPAEWVTPTQPPHADFVARVRDYMLKAVREAKVHTSWITQNPDYETAMSSFVDGTLSDAAVRFLGSFIPFQQKIARLGMINSLAQLTLKVAAPGVPDFYQGTELWDLSLVDPDNRRPVDYAKRQRLLHGLEPLLTAEAADGRADGVAEILTHWNDGRIKLFVTATALRLRRRLPALFLEGTYEPLQAHGERADHVVAFARRDQQHAVVVVVPRLVAQLTSDTHWFPIGTDTWGDTRLFLAPAPAGRSYQNVLTGEWLHPEPVAGMARLPVEAVLRVCPVAILVAANDPH